eukprot:TRINITY_DN26663_c0_g1_i1.p1 TRINITY_DN26663_c0_g1~~TRINITY_DN26663_c0_g1_i1.p1  ORF type:complete len:216 (-),score=76.54 TRINITY_DN26663_c0_g1_i1:424-1071(-)
MDELAMEIEALQAIYMDDFQMLGESPTRFQIVLVPQPGGTNYVGLTVEVELSPGYPNEAPTVHLVDSFGISGEQIDALEDQVKVQAEAELGTSMIFNLAATVKEWLDDNNVDPEAKERARRLKEEEEIEKRRALGTPVTVDTFTIWAENFYARLEQERLAKEKTKTKLTGRQMFESNKELVLSDAAFAEEGDKAVEVDWSVFKDEALDDLPDDDE